MKYELLEYKLYDLVKFCEYRGSAKDKKGLRSSKWGFDTHTHARTNLI